ncbi:MAG: hypothetical protein HUK21_07635 [Fibrobacteraceae bacterium]|nr:hypothetical protein [Fibrobacteraceae bacterium]
MNLASVSKTFLMVSLFLASLTFADDIIATTSNGSTVILHENGRWEYYQNNAKIRDVRPEAIPEDAKFQVTVYYESFDKLKKNKRMELEGLLATEDEIKDSLRALPKGGILYFQVPTKQLKPSLKREWTYSVFTGGKKPIFEKMAMESDAVKSDSKDYSNLMVVPLFSRIKGKAIKARVENRKYHQTLDFDVPVN